MDFYEVFFMKSNLGEQENCQNESRDFLLVLTTNFSEITLTKEFCAQPLSLVWLMFIHKAEVEKDN